jgi:AraC-like DNA-binding protein
MTSSSSGDQHLFASGLIYRPSYTVARIPVGPGRKIDTFEFADVAVRYRELANIVEGVTDWDIPDGDMARRLAIKVLPSTTPYVIVQYRTSMGSCRRFGSICYEHRQYRHVATRAQTGIITIRPTGPLGAIIVRLRPEAAARVLGDHMQHFANAKIALGDIFNDGDVSLLQAMVSDAQSSSERIAHVLRFLLANVSQLEVDPAVCCAVASLRRNPALRVRRLAEELDVSERHLSRRFNTIFGESPKQFARFARIEKVLRARSTPSSWADIAYACGYADQAHMIRDFNAIAGAPPEHVLRPPSIEEIRDGIAPLRESISRYLFVC